MPITFGHFDITLLGVVLSTLALTHITIASTTIYLHRFSAHHAISLHPAVQHFFRFWLWLTTGTVTKEWTAVHRKHHAKCETVEDPHSPKIVGIRTVLLQGAELYRKEAQNRQTLEQYGKGTPNDWLERNIYTPHNHWGPALMGCIDLAIFGPIGITIWAIQMMWIPIFAAGIINGAGHYVGYRNFECSDQSTNLIPWGILIGGEELHNNHHAYPNSAKLSHQKWEIDLGWFYINILSFLGLAQIRSVPPKAVHNQNKFDVDLDTIKAVLSSRLQLIEQYKKKVVMPLVEKERASAAKQYNDLFKRAKHLIVREKTLVNDRDQIDLHQIWKLSPSLKTAYEFKERLQQIWEKTATNKNEMVNALKQWCQEAERSGIEALEEFAVILRGYTLQTA